MFWFRVTPFSSLIAGTFCLVIGVPAVIICVGERFWVPAVIAALDVLGGIGWVAGCVRLRRAGRPWFGG